MTQAQQLRKLRRSLQRFRAYCRRWFTEPASDEWDKRLGWFLPWGRDKQPHHD